MSIDIVKLNNNELTSFKTSYYHEQLNLANNKLKSIPKVNISKVYSGNNLLKILNISNNNLSGTLDMTRFYKIKELHADNNKISGIKFQNNPSRNTVTEKIKVLTLSDNKLKSIDLIKLGKLETLNVRNNDISYINNMDEAKNLKTLNISNNKFSQLGIDLSLNKKLVNIYADNAGLKSIDVSKNTKLEYLSIAKNPLTSLDVSKNKKLKYVWTSLPKSKVNVGKNKNIYIHTS